MDNANIQPEDEFVDEEDLSEVIPLDRDDDAAEPEDVDMDDSESEETYQDQSSLTYAKHTGDVFTIHASNSLVASGGEDDRAYVWNLDTGDTVFECTGHADSVTQVRFNYKGTLLATADMAGLVIVWRVEQWTKQLEFQTGDLEWLQWHHTADILLCGGADGSVWMYLVPNGDCKIFGGGYNHSCGVGALMPDGKRLCAGYSDGNVRIWDLKSASSTTLTGASVHRSAVTSLDVYQDNVLAASGCEDGSTNLLHTTTGKIIATFVGSKGTETQSSQEHGAGDGATEDQEPELNSVEALAFSNVSPMLFVGTVNGDAMVWDINSHIVRQSFSQQNVGVVKAIWIEHCVLLGGLDGTMSMYDSRDGLMVRRWTGHKAAILDFAVTSHRESFVSAAADHTCKRFSLEFDRRF